MASEPTKITIRGNIEVASFKSEVKFDLIYHGGHLEAGMASKST